ncbi:DUF4132 domain-containing protein [Actinoplanes sp. NBRC 103695]|uniref:DUF4132 domain-containing protein n=1 Tax=Actinoplanes sp. NBRC 103695 TaxID=3032202 RepID=UPI0025530228|nr:DUF4132 domain-containing protein [Actinoplanes sp. NBRC 103695]
MHDAIKEGLSSGDYTGVADLDPPARREALLELHAYFIRNDSTLLHWVNRGLPYLEGLSVPFTRDDLTQSLGQLLADTDTLSDGPFWVPGLIAASLDPADLTGFKAELAQAFRALQHGFDMPAEAARRLSRLYGNAMAPLYRGVPADLLAAIAVLSDEVRTLLPDPAVHPLLRHAADLAKPVPPKAWLRTTDEMIAATPRAGEAATALLAGYRSAVSPVDDHVDALLRGLIWVQSRTPGEESTALLSDVATVLGAPERRGSARLVAPKAAVAAVEVLGSRSGDAPIRALARLSLTVRSKSFRPRVRAALERLGRDRAWAPGEALELTVDDHGLDPDGRCTWPMGEGAAGVVETAGGRARLRAYRDGSALRAVPPGWKDALAPARAAVSEINKTLAVERLRIEGLLSQERLWSWETWAERYLAHPIVRVFARELIWEFSPDGTTWTSGLPALASPDPSPGPGWQVRLWHPARAGADDVARWRDRVLAAGLRQPIKQAFREVYALTPAEEQTGTYSNRFAAHILHYRQANALMRERGWSANYLGEWGAGRHGEATKEFAAGGWRASFFHDWVESTWEQPYCTTDQVRFGRRDGRAWAATPLAEVPPLVLTEAMRDVDLFVGVTSIAADDGWRDRGEHRFDAYWGTAAFAELTPGAEVRRDVLTRLLPRLTVGPRCTLDGRFLRVEGKLGAYRIHLGSGNILMEPDDAYLCIVPDRAKAKKLSLPFDDDPILSVILSKAIMLAADDRITDPSITRQLHRSRL